MKEEHESDVKRQLTDISDDSLLSILERTPFAILIVSVNGEIEYANEDMTKLTGISSQKIKGLSVHEIPALRDSEFATLIGMAIENKKSVVEQVTFNASKEKRGYGRFIGIPLIKGEEGKVLIILEDLSALREYEEKLRREREAFFYVFDNLPVGIIVTDDKGAVLYINREFTEITGYTNEDIPDGRTFFRKAYPDPETRREIKELWKMAQRERVRDTFQFKIKCKDGREKEVEFKSEYLEDGKVVTTLTDITSIKMMERELLESERRFRSIFENSRDAIYITSYEGKFIDVNQAFCDMFGEKKEEILKKSAKEAYVSEHEKIRLKTAIKKDGFVKDFEIRLKKVNGEIMDCLLTVTGIKDSSGRVVEYHGIVRDITEKKKAEEKIRYLAFHDTLTGLPNRTLFTDRFNMAMGHAKREKKMLAVMMLDIDGFKHINDTYGHGLGDFILMEVAERLKNTVRRTDTIARMGGDEFIGIFTEIKGTGDVETIAQKIMRSFSTPVGAQGRMFTLTVSMGFSIYPAHGSDLDSLLSRADFSMYEIKQTGGNGFKIYDMKNAKAP